MRFIADLHIHSKYSRATSRDMSPEVICKWAQIKGIGVVGTGDFTHPGWLKELSEKIWSDAIADKDATTLKLKCRTLQDQIFDHRKKNPPIFDFVFRWFRDGNEVLMNKGAEALVREHLNAPSR